MQKSSPRSRSLRYFICEIFGNGDAMLVSLWGAQIWPPETNRNICFWAFLQMGEFFAWEIYSETRNVQIAKSQKIGNVVINPHKSFPGRQIKMPRHAKNWKLKRPLSLNKEPFRTENLIELRCLNVVIPHESRNSEDVESFLVWILVTSCVNREHKYGRGFELGTSENKSSEWPERDANPGPRVFESHALTTRPRCYVW